MQDYVIYVNPCFLTLVASKTNSSMIIFENNGWFLMLQVELEIESLLR
jgi:hypothetical protein